MGIKFFADQRVDAVGADQNVTVAGVSVRAAAVEEIGDYAGVVLGERAQPTAEMNTELASRARTA